jgi:hypothetical protein
MARPVGSGRAWRTFEAAREFIRTLGLANSRAWVAYAKTPDRPEDIPYDPNRHYAEFAGWPDLLGDSYVKANPRAKYNYLSYDEVSAMARAAGVTTKAEYDTWRKTFDATRVPWNPAREYPDRWSSWSDFLQSGKPVRNRRDWMPFEEARKLVRELNLKSSKEFVSWRNQNLEVAIPGAPDDKYDCWQGWDDFLGVQGFLTFEEAKAILRPHRLRTNREFRGRLQAHPEAQIPTQPHLYYQPDWIGLPWRRRHVGARGVRRSQQGSGERDVRSRRLHHPSDRGSARCA